MVNKMAWKFSAITQFQISNHKENTLNSILERTNYHTKYHFDKQSILHKKPPWKGQTFIDVFMLISNRHTDLTKVNMWSYIFVTLFLLTKTFINSNKYLNKLDLSKQNKISLKLQITMETTCIIYQIC